MQYSPNTNPVVTLSPYMERLLREKKVAREFQERKHADWNETYELSRGKTKTNRLTQRQAVNIPLMKETEKTILAKIDEAPTANWSELSGDEEKELIMQSLWDDWAERKNLEGVDIQDKKNCLRYGRPTIKLMPSEDDIDIAAMDIYDVVYDPLMNPLDVETARFIVHQNIYRSLKEILADERYENKGKDALKLWAASDFGLVQSNENKKAMDERNERLKSMGVDSDDFDKFAGSDVIVNITEHYHQEWDAKQKKFVRMVCVYADDQFELMKEKLVDLTGVEEYPFVTWADDIETNDIWSDSVDDIIRVPNKILNVWFSQLTENRTLKNFQMHWYDATKEGYSPQTYEPGPGVMLPAPGNPKETIMPVDISGLDDTLEAIGFITQIVERATGATAIDKGVGEQGTQTLGEVQVLVGKAMERATNMAKFYRRARYELAMKWYHMMEANVDKSRMLYKTGASGKVYPKTIKKKDWSSEAGYKATISSSSEQEQEQVKTIQKFLFVMQSNPNNLALRRIAQKRNLESLDLTPDELREVEEFDRQLEESSQQPTATPQTGGTPSPLQVTQPNQGLVPAQ